MRAAVAAMIALLGAATSASAQSDPLPSWRNGAAKAAIIESIVRVTTPGDVGFVPATERMAVFDNDATLGPEQSDLSYGPMVELLALLRRAGFRTRTVSAGSGDVLRVFIGRQDKARPEATTREWIVVDLKRDWKVTHPLRFATIPGPVLPDAWLSSQPRLPFIIR